MLKLNRKMVWDLAAIADREIHATLSGQRSTPAAQNRVEAVGMTVSSALPAAAEAWRPLMSRLGVRARLVGAFSFGAPLVEIIDAAGARRHVPLADLMIVVDDFRSAHASRMALLIRTRLATDETKDEANETQGLDPARPALRMRGRGYGKAPRDLRNPAAARSAEDSGRRLATIGLRPAAWACTKQGATDGDLTLGRVIAAMAAGREGRPATRGGRDDWSLTIDELLKRTVHATLRALASPTETLRSATTVAGMAGTGHVLFENPTQAPYEEAIVIDGLEGPISVVHLCIEAAAGPVVAVAQTSRARPKSRRAPASGVAG